MPDVPDLAAASLTLLLVRLPRAIWLFPDWCGKWLDLRDRWRDGERATGDH